jgi:hypothetical protein
LGSAGQQDAEKQHGQAPAPKTASPVVLREQACKKAVTPGTSNTASLAISLVLSCSAAMFQVPATTRTAKAGQASDGSQSRWSPSLV